MTAVTTYYLQMDTREEFRSVAAHPELTILECDPKLPQFNRFLYQYVGADWQWVDRLGWSEADWNRYVAREELRTFVGYVGGTPAGYYELEKQDAGDVEIAYFGLGPQFIGRGMGGYLLSHAIETAWGWGARRVWVHTCTLDHPAAMENYRARGMHVYKEELTEAD